MKALARTVGRQFSRPSGLLGRLAGLVMATRPSNRARNLRTLELLAIQREDRVLEIGFGPGFALARALELASRGHVVGIDHSELMLAQVARRNAAAIAAGRLELRLARAEDLALPPASFDKAYAVNVLMFWRDPVAVLRFLRPALRPGGLLAITQQPRNSGATSADTTRSATRITTALTEAGFTDIRAEILEMKPVNATCVLARAPFEQGR